MECRHGLDEYRFNAGKYDNINYNLSNGVVTIRSTSLNRLMEFVTTQILATEF